MKLQNKWTCGLVAALTFVACGTQELGSRYVKTQNVRASEGAIFAVETGELNGTRLELPAGALSADTTVTVEIGLTSILGAELSAGPAAVFGPAGTTFTTDVTLVLPVRGLAASDDVGIVGLAADGTSFEVDAAQVALDATRTRATFRIRQLANYQPRRRAACTSNADCATGLACVNGRCRTAPPTTGTDGGTTGSCPMSCPTGSACDPARQVCVVQPTGCTTTMNCPTNFACLNGACVPPTTNTCGMNAACASGQACLNGVCVPVRTDGGSTNPNACMSNADCAMNATCVNGVCQVQCVPSAEVCNMVDDDCDGVIDEGCSTTPDAGIMCGGFAGFLCPMGLTCVDDPADNCDPNMGGADCGGVCVVPTCAGFLGLACPSGLTCVDDPADSCDPNMGGSDCGGLCVTPQVSDGGMGNPGACRTSMDCANGGQCINGVCQ